MLQFRRLSQSYPQACILAGVTWAGDGRRYYVRLNARGEAEAWCPTLPWADLPLVKLKGAWLSPGGFDLQINGALGLAFNDLEPDDLPQLGTISDWLYAQGLDAILPTLITNEAATRSRSLAVLAQWQSPLVKGIHLEGPFLNPAKRGVHPAVAIQPLRQVDVEPLLQTAPIALITLAPEQMQAPDLITWLCQRPEPVRVSLGHTLANTQQAQAAFAAGADLVTHLFNAMPPLHHREPSVVGVALTSDSVWCCLIADGQHLHPLILKLVLQATARVIVVSDALAPLGLGDGAYPWGDAQQITVSQGTARLTDGTLAGTTQPLLQAVSNLVNWGVCSLPVAIATVCLNPYRWFYRDQSWGQTPQLGDLLLWETSP